MPALLKFIPVEAIILFLLRTLQGISASDWRIALQSVIAASKARDLPSGESKFSYVWSAFAGTELPDKALRWLIESAVSFAAYKGLTKKEPTV